MKIIKTGNWNNPWSHECVCSNTGCGATLEIDEADLKPTDNQGGKYYFTCPICESSVDVPSKDIPPRITRLLDGKRKYYSGWGD